MLAINQIQMTDNYDYYELPIETEDVTEDVISGLNAQQKSLSPKYFYDQTGSELFDQITQLPEYYQTRTELSILKDYASEIAAYLTEDTTLIEYGSGNTEKLRALLAIATPREYVPVEISQSHLKKFSQSLASDYPHMQISAIRADYSKPWALPEEIKSTKKLAYFAGSSLGNFTPEESIEFLKQVRAHVGNEGGLLIGIDNKKNKQTLHNAYNDSQGVTAKFNLNCLDHLNKLIKSDFQTSNFEHVAFYNEELGRIEMHLKSLCEQTIHIGDQTFNTAFSETIHTENSYKYSYDEFNELCKAAGFSIEHHWQDDDELFSIYYLH